MGQQNQKQGSEPPDVKQAAEVIDITARTGLVGDPSGFPLHPNERRALRALLAIGPERILAAVKAVETLRHACPTARRELAAD